MDGWLTTKSLDLDEIRLEILCEHHEKDDRIKMCIFNNFNVLEITETN